MVDLIYTDSSGKDVAILKEYEFDLAYGKDENDFELIMPLRNAILDVGNRLYISDTEYGGIVDGIRVNTNAKSITYVGRTWHGILANKIIQSPASTEYIAFDGDANEVIAEIIELLDLSVLFEAETEPSGFEISSYKVDYQDAYTALKEMLELAGAKLMVRYIDGKVELSAEALIDYTSDEQWDTKQRNFDASRNYRTVNHLICIGAGELEERLVIHLFMNENGIMPYSIDNPVKDDDYILDERNRYYSGTDEVTAVLENTNGRYKENYIQLATQPADYANEYYKYYYYDAENEKYYNLEAVVTTSYPLIDTKPSDWDTNYSNYYDLNERAVSAETVPVYSKPLPKPWNWSDVYSNYYTYYDDGTGEPKYKSVASVTKEYYVQQIQQPSDWNTNYENYFYKATVYKPNKNNTWKAKTYYAALEGKDGFKLLNAKPKDWKNNYKGYFIQTTEYASVVKTAKGAVPKWKKNKYYTRKSESVSPKWDTKQTYHLQTSEVQQAPNFEVNKFKRKVETRKAPAWLPNTYYECYIDHYADLVEEGIEKLSEYYKDSSSIDIGLESDTNYYIGDIVGAIDGNTGLEVRQPITKKIVTINSKKTKVTYEVG